jgi:hypothetical protein
MTTRYIIVSATVALPDGATAGQRACGPVFFLIVCFLGIRNRKEAKAQKKTMNAITAREVLTQQRNCLYATNQVRPQHCAFAARMSKKNGIILVVLGCALAPSSKGADDGLALAPNDPTSGKPEAFAAQQTGIWQGEVGEGFRSSVQTVSLEAGVAFGVQAFGGELVHDIALLSVSYGHMWGKVTGKDHWYRGNWELRAELFGGGQFDPNSALLAGLTPHLRYNFATGTRWIPFADLGAGVTASGVGPPDQNGIFEFNLQANAGIHWFVRDDLALTAEVGYLHMSCANINEPNLGVNTVKGMFGATWFF